ncbi:MAG: LysM peptidoglycan-binding domain-containing protein [Candidatus Methylacidiphilales bacterium]|nr:LysM peptidoglycan-binding domain-containing protein [Candidatus Methylacidiphilales bacterium]
MRRRHFIQGLCACCGSLGLPGLLATPREVRKGDTLYSISRQCEVSVADLMAANPGIDPTKLKPGQVLQIPAKEPPPAKAGPPPSPPAAGSPADKTEKTGTDKPDPSTTTPETGDKKTETPVPPEFHIVAKGDTLYSISRTRGIPLAELRQLNPSLAGIITPGQQLRIRPSTKPFIDSGPPPEPEDKPQSPEEKTEDGPPPKKQETGNKKPEPPPPPKYVFVAGKSRNLIDKPKITTRDWRYIVTHHSGTRTGNAKIFDYYHRQVRGMENGLAYHFVIGNGTDSGDGEIEVGDRWLKQLQGGHVRSDAQNEIAIGICLVGDFQRDRPTRRQIAALIELTGYLQDKVGTPRPRFYLHRDINIISTDCPGRLFPAAALYSLFGGKPPKPKE